MNHPLIRFFLALCLLFPLADGAIAASPDNTELQIFKAQTEAKMEAAKEGQQKDFQHQKELIEQINHQVDWLGHLIALGSAIITLLIVGIGYFAYGKVKSDAQSIAQAAAKEEANTTSKAEVKRWFDDNLSEVRNEINALKETLKQTAVEVGAHADHAHHSIEASKAEIQTHAKEVIARTSLSVNKLSTLTEADKQAVSAADNALKDKPESEYTFDDWNTRAFAEFIENNWVKASDYWGKAVQAKGITNIQHAKALLGQGIAFTEQSNFDVAVTCCQQVVERFGESPILALQVSVANALVSQGIALGEQLKFDEAIACCQQVITRFGESSLPVLQEVVASGFVLQALALRQKKKYSEAVASYQQILKRFGDSDLPKLQEVVQMAHQGITAIQMRQNNPHA